MKISVRAGTDIGRVRTHNEDYHKALGGDEAPPGVDALLVVADGMGGHAAGEVASQMTVEGVVQALANRSVDSPELEDTDFGGSLGTALEEVNREVWRAGQEPDKKGMGTTCTLAAVRDGKLFLANIGDSRAYLLRDGELHQVTKDHSWVEEAVDQGIVSREDARTHPNRNIITRAIGLDQEVTADRFMEPLTEGDLVLLCSDGLNSMLTDEEIRGVLLSHPLEEVCQALIDAANNQGGHDNTTVAVATIGAQRRSSRTTMTGTADRDTREVATGSSWWKTVGRVIGRRS